MLSLIEIISNIRFLLKYKCYVIIELLMLYDLLYYSSSNGFSILNTIYVIIIFIFEIKLIINIIKYKDITLILPNDENIWFNIINGFILIMLFFEFIFYVIEIKIWNDPGAFTGPILSFDILLYMILN